MFGDKSAFDKVKQITNTINAYAGRLDTYNSLSEWTEVGEAILELYNNTSDDATIELELQNDIELVLIPPLQKRW